MENTMPSVGRESPRDLSPPAEAQLPTRRSGWPSILSSSVTVLGVAAAAAYTSAKTEDKGVGIAAWVAVAVVGAASSISAARNRRPHSTSGSGE
ncbi:hypothetical protein [Fuerstiella marisgermanici]|nr:hypothetical protein [Fuerstiella marisgermanici]